MNNSTSDKYNDYASMLKHSSWIHDAELDDAVLGALLRQFGSDPISLRICTEDKDGGVLGDLKTKMFKSVVGKSSDFQITMENDYRLSPEEKNKRNAEIIQKKSKRLDDFCRSLAPVVERLGRVPLIVTAPTFGILRYVQEYFGLKLMVFVYSGQYNLQNMPELIELVEQGKAFVVDTSRYPVLKVDAPLVRGLDDPHGSSKEEQGKEPERLQNFFKMTEGTDFWQKFQQMQPDKCQAVQDFLRAFNAELIRPGRLFTDDLLKDTKTIDKLNQLYETAVSSDNINQEVLDQYCALVTEKYMPLVKSWKQTMVNNLDKDAPACDMFIGLFTLLNPEEITIIEGEWKVGRFSDVVPGDKINAMKWKIEMKDESLMIDRITNIIFSSLLN